LEYRQGSGRTVEAASTAPGNRISNGFLFLLSMQLPRVSDVEVAAASGCLQIEAGIVAIS
jgi:hypothetical protein